MVRVEPEFKTQNDSKIPNQIQIDINPIAEAELEQLRMQVATLEDRTKNAEIERDEWKAKAKSLAGNFFGTLKDLKSSLHSIKRDQQDQMRDLRFEFEERFRNIAN